MKNIFSWIAAGFVMIGGGLCGLADEKPVFDYRETTLKNGLHVITLEDFSCPIVSVQVWYHVGSKDEKPDRQGFAHMFEHMMFRGTDRLGPTDHFDFIQRAGGTCNAYTTFDQTVYHQELPVDQLDLALWLEAERMSFLKIDQASYDTERKIVEEERRMGLNRPYGDVFEKLLAEVFQKHPYRWSTIGQISHLRAASVKELREFWTRYYVPNNATLVVVGAVKHAAAQDLAKKYFEWIPRGAEPVRVSVSEPLLSARSVTLQVDSAPVPMVARGFRTVPMTSDDMTALDLLATIVGGGESSRLYRELVADTQMATVAEATSNNLEQDGIWGVGALLTLIGGDLGKVSEVLEKNIQRLRNEPVSEHELTKAKNQMLRGIVTGNLTVAEKASALGSAAVLEHDVARVNRRIQAVKKLMASDLQQAARKYFVPEHELEVKVERSLAGSFPGGKTESEDPPITAIPETVSPPPGRAGTKRPESFPVTAPLASPHHFEITPQFTEHKLANGLKVLVVPNHEVPFVSITLGLWCGALYETRPGTVSMAFDLLTKGSAKHTEGELADELETYAINLGGSGGMDDSSVSADCLPEHLERTLNLMSEVVMTPKFSVEEFEKLRTQVRTGLAIDTQKPRYLADREFRRRLYGSHPYSRSTAGELVDVDALTIEEIRSWWAANPRPDQAVLIFAGDITDDLAQKLAGTAFGNWKAPMNLSQGTLPAPPSPALTRIYLVDSPGAIQSEIRVGQLGITRHHPDYFTSRVVNGYFGEQFGARLNDTLRVKRGLTYGAWGGYHPGRQYGSFAVSTFTKTETTAATVTGIFEELQRLQNEPPSEKELHDNIAYTLGSFPLGRETPQQVADDLWLIESEGLPKDYFTKLLKGVAKTDAAASSKLVKATLDPAKQIVVVVGDASKIREGLEKIAPVIVVK